MRHRVTFLVWFGVALSCAWLGFCAARGRAAPDQPPSAATEQSAPVGFENTAALDTARRPVEAAPSSLPTTAASFDEYVDRLVDLGVRMWQAVERKDLDGAGELDQVARAVLLELCNRVPATDEKALHRLTGLLTEDKTVTGEVRRRVLKRILQDGLEERLGRFQHTASRTPLDQLVEGILRAIPQDEVVATDLGTGMLVDRPYMDVAHEPAVLDIVELAAEQAFLLPVASALLLTLWHNLESSGARTSSHLASLALLFRDDSNPSRRMAALKHLLLAEDGRYRDLVVRQVLTQKDVDLAREVAMTAARAMPPASSMKVLEQLSELGSERLMGAFVMLGSRDPGVLIDTYERKLADSVSPRLRAELVTGAGFELGAKQLEMAQGAFDHDPDAEVRARALFVLSSHPDSARAESAILTALDDPRNAQDPASIGRIVLALQNFASTGEANGLARIGQRLRTHPALQPKDRDKLEEILAQHLPDGGRR